MKCRLKRASSSRLGEILHWKEEENTRANDKSVSITAPFPAFTNPPIYLFQIFRLLLMLFLWHGNRVPYLKDKHYIAFTALLLSAVLLTHLVLLSMFIVCTFPRDVNPEVWLQTFENILSQTSTQKLYSTKTILCISPPFPQCLTVLNKTAQCKITKNQKKKLDRDPVTYMSYN